MPSAKRHRDVPTGAKRRSERLLRGLTRGCPGIYTKRKTMEAPSEVQIHLRNCPVMSLSQ